MCDIHAPMTTFFKQSYIGIAACLEQMTREIIQRTVAVVVKNSSKFEKLEDMPIAKMDTYIKLYHVNMALHYPSGIDAVRSYSSNPIFEHRKQNYEEEFSKELKKKRNEGRPRRPIKKRVRESVDKHNTLDLLYPEEIMFHVAVENVLPIIFKDMSFSEASVIPNVRFDMLPSYMVDRYSGCVTGKSYIRNNPESVRMLEFISRKYCTTERGSKWNDMTL
jgi:hypothetical protein